MYKVLFIFFFSVPSLMDRSGNGTHQRSIGNIEAI